MPADDFVTIHHSVYTITHRTYYKYNVIFSMLIFLRIEYTSQVDWVNDKIFESQ